MNLIKSTLGIRGHTILYVLIGLLVSEASPQAADRLEAELSSVKLRLHLLENRYRHLCNFYSNLATNSSLPVINCTECPDKWLQVGDQCFFLITDKQDWSFSAQNCREMGGHLAILTTREQHEAVEKEGRRIAGFYTNYWIGLTDIENEGDWKWVDNSTLTNPYILERGEIRARQQPVQWVGWRGLCGGGQLHSDLVRCSLFLLVSPNLSDGRHPAPVSPTTPLQDHHSIMKDIDTLFKNFTGNCFYSLFVSTNKQFSDKNLIYLV
ncbi:hepatic lectin-like isoform X1 [Siniperca chuatsi]|uniref:hepatic lectin-like isoform X1 n=1 Tax=Siniperca chuatsi TaxID=119488 RepID=UPI001CE1A2FD|nr:hepatic lectin-like isoform X1 [Siniperca chuatsi]